MMTRKAGSCLLIFFVISINHETVTSAKDKVLGGDLVKLGELPYMAIIGNGNYFCSGAIVTPNHVLTGAQCIYLRVGKLSANIRVHVGTVNTFGGDIHYVKHVAIHPGFWKNYPKQVFYDVGILTLCKRIIFDEYKKPIKLPSEEVIDGEKAIMSGWGTPPSGYPSEELSKVTMTVYSYENCSADVDLGSEIKDRSQMCTMDQVTKGICNIDQGGPLVIDERIVGIASIRRGKNCEKGKIIFTSIFQTLNFIRAEIDPMICRNPSFATTVMTRIEDMD